ncbi:FBCDB protein, partial [Nothoprocta pentlandii]|nr:FBCDB protein [Nothoprocta pentlandii]
PQRMSCGYVLCTVLLSVAVLLAVTVTGAILFMNHYHPPVTESPPVISTNPEEANALVTIERADSSRINIFIDPNCPDQAGSFTRLEGLQSSVLRALSEHDAEAKAAKGQQRALLATVADEVAKLLAHAAQLRADCDGLKKGHGAMGQELSALQSEQGRLIQVRAGRCASYAPLPGPLLIPGPWKSLRERDSELCSHRLQSPAPRMPLRGWFWEKGTLPRGFSALLPCPGSRPRDCFDIYASGQQEDGIYSIFPIHFPSGFQVYCDMSTDGGGWTVFQRREDGSVNFFRGWQAYRDGFGKLTGEHWLGLQRLHVLTVQASYELRVDLEDFDNGTAFARYGSFGVGVFSVDAEEDGYPVSVADYSGTAGRRRGGRGAVQRGGRRSRLLSPPGDSFLKHNGMRFTTKDLDNDHSENNCAAFYHGAWWYRNCHTSNLNGQYLKGHHSSYADGIEWSSWTGWQYSLKFTEMKIRPVREEN